MSVRVGTHVLISCACPRPVHPARSAPASASPSVNRPSCIGFPLIGDEWTNGAPHHAVRFYLGTVIRRQNDVGSATTLKIRIIIQRNGVGPDITHRHATARIPQGWRAKRVGGAGGHGPCRADAF